MRRPEGSAFERIPGQLPWPATVSGMNFWSEYLRIPWHGNLCKAPRLEGKGAQTTTSTQNLKRRAFLPSTNHLTQVTPCYPHLGSDTAPWKIPELMLVDQHLITNFHTFPMKRTPFLGRAASRLLQFLHLLQMLGTFQAWSTGPAKTQWHWRGNM